MGQSALRSGNRVSDRSTTHASQLWFTAPYRVEVREAILPAPEPEQVLVKSRHSAVSAGTELLAYRGQLPQSIPLDSALASLQSSSEYPLQYGYACVGEVQTLGSAVDPDWQGRLVFSFQPHCSHFLASLEELQRVPDGVSAKDAVFLPNMETAVNLVQDGSPLLGERVVVVGQGVVGLLVSAILAGYPLSMLVAIEQQADRQELAKGLGVDRVLRPKELQDTEGILDAGYSNGFDADLVFEVSGDPAALNLAIALGGFASRIVIGSWYGKKTAAVELGGPAHRNRLQFITSQVSTIAPALRGRWNKQRRFEIAWEMIRRIGPGKLVTHTLPLERAGELYQQLHEQQPGFTQVLFDYQD